MKQYKVLKEMINAPVGTILSNEISNNYLCHGNTGIIETHAIGYAIDQGFIEPYTPEPKRWRAENGSRYWYVDENNVARMCDDDYGNFDNDMYNSSNYYKLQATAELVAKAQKLFFEWLHDKEAEKITNPLFGFGITDDLCVAMDESRKACLQDDTN